MFKKYQKYLKDTKKSLINNSNPKGEKTLKLAKVGSVLAGVALGFAGGTGIFTCLQTTAAVIASTTGASPYFAGIMAGLIGSGLVAITLNAGYKLAQPSVDCGVIALADGFTNKNDGFIKKTKKLALGALLTIGPTATALTVGYLGTKNIIDIANTNKLKMESSLQETQSIKKSASKVFRCKKGEQLVFSPIENNAVKYECVKMK